MKQLFSFGIIRIVLFLILGMHQLDAHQTMFIIGPHSRYINWWYNEAKNLCTALQKKAAQRSTNFSYFPSRKNTPWWDRNQYYPKGELSNLYEFSIEGLAQTLATNIALFYQNSLKLQNAAALSPTAAWERTHLVSYGTGFSVMKRAIRYLVRHHGSILARKMLGKLMAIEVDEKYELETDEEFWREVDEPVDFIAKHRAAHRFPIPKAHRPEPILPTLPETEYVTHDQESAAGVGPTPPAIKPSPGAVVVDGVALNLADLSLSHLSSDRSDGDAAATETEVSHDSTYSETLLDGFSGIRLYNSFFITYTTMEELKETHNIIVEGGDDCFSRCCSSKCCFFSACAACILCSLQNN